MLKMKMATVVMMKVMMKVMCGMSSSDTGYINASAEGVNIQTVVNLVGDDQGRLRISNITCGANISKMKAQFSGTLG